MVAEDLSGVLALQTPVRQAQSIKQAFSRNVQACLVKFIQCSDIEITFQVRQEFLQLKAKVERAEMSSRFQDLLKPASRKLAVSCEFHELLQVQTTIQSELDELRNHVFGITEQKLAAGSTAGFNAYTNVKNRVDPLKASMQFLPLRLECFKMDALQWFPNSVVFLEQEQHKLMARIQEMDEAFLGLDALFRLDRPIQRPVVKSTSSIPVLNLQLRGQRRSTQSLKPAFSSKLPKPTEIKTRPMSDNTLRHRRSSSQWSSISSNSSDMCVSPPKIDTSRPRIFEAPMAHGVVHGVAHGMAIDPYEPRPKSRLVRPTPIELPKRKEKENDEPLSRIPISARRNVLSTISENSAIPKFQSPLKARRSTAHLYTSGNFGAPLGSRRS